MKILIMVLSGGDADYNKLRQAQKDTWDSIEVEGVDTIYYMAANEYKQEGKDLYVKCPNELNMAAYRLKLALDWIYNTNDPGYDYIFRTNASSYVDKQRLKEWLQDKPRHKFYCGRDGGGFASGCGFALSTDLVNILRTIDDYPTDSEDCLIGVYLQRENIGVYPGALRWDFYPHSPQHNIPKIYHYRCKSDDLDRTKDVTAFNHIHKLLGYE